MFLQKKTTLKKTVHVPGVHKNLHYGKSTKAV